MSEFDDKKKSYILTGISSALSTIVLVIVLFAFFGGFRYRNIVMLDSNYISKEEVQSTLTTPETELLGQMHQKGILMTPSEYTGHLATYYDTLVAFLAVLFVLFSIIGYLGIRGMSRKEVSQVAKDVLNDSYELKTDLKAMIMGEIDENMVHAEDYENDMQKLQEIVDECVANIDEMRESALEKDAVIVDKSVIQIKASNSNGNKGTKNGK